MKIKTYKLSSDKKGLLAYFGKNFYHIHSGELTRKERKEHKKLLGRNFKESSNT